MGNHKGYPYEMMEKRSHPVSISLVRQVQDTATEGEAGRTGELTCSPFSDIVKPSGDVHFINKKSVLREAR